MPRPPLEVGTWGRIKRTEVEPGRHVARARFRDVDGRTRQVEAWGKSGAAAERTLVKALKDRAKTAGDTITSATRVEKLADFWLRTKVDGSGLAVNTKYRYRWVTEKAVVPGLGGLLLRECTTARLDAWVKRYAADGGQGNARLARTCLQGMFSVAVREGALDANPMREVETIAASSGTEVRALSVREVVELRACLRQDAAAVSVHLPELVDVMLATGCRIGEALALRWAEVDLGAGVLHLTGTVVRDPKDGLFRQDTTKGKKVTALWLPMWCVEVLEKHLVTVPAGPLGLVFPSAADGLREVSTVEKQWRAFRARNPQWSWITPKTFRKTVGTELARKAGLAAAGEQLTHSNTAVTAKHYVARPEAATDHSRLLEAFGA